MRGDVPRVRPAGRWDTRELWLGVLVVVVLLYPGAMGVDSTVSPRTLTPTVRPADASMASTTSLLKQTARSRSTQWRDHRKLVQCVRRSEQRLVAVRSGIPLRTVDIGGGCMLLSGCVCMCSSLTSRAYPDSVQRR